MYWEKSDTWHLLKFIFACLILLVILIFCLSSMLQGFCDRVNEQFDMIEDKVISGYALYLDGEKVSLSTVDLSQYDISIDDDKKTVFLSN